MEKSKIFLKAQTKQCSQPKEIEDDEINISYDLEDETDDAGLEKN